ncbi:MAG TPA: AraC family ligand binding domain-containing protein, partial [Anaerovoracaceae bacterium]|nr:AraC family ligand binding domain-containing protein [Anaerovoracaceae bacterium]
MNIEANRMIYLNQNSITGQTFHWHDELELLLVAEGSLCLRVGYEELLLNKGDIMLINSDEIHSLKETDESNVVVCTYIDCNVVYEKYPDFYEIVAIWPYSDAFKKLNQQKHTILRQINNIAVALEEGATDEKIINSLDALLRSLIYCYRLDITDPDGAGFQVTDEKKDVIYRTIKYLYSNYNNKA